VGSRNSEKQIFNNNGSKSTFFTPEFIRWGTGLKFTEIIFHLMKTSRQFKRWFVSYCALVLDLPVTVLNTLFPSPSQIFGKDRWEFWATFFRSELKEAFSTWPKEKSLHDWGSEKTIGTKRGCWVEEIVVTMEAEKNVTIVQGHPKQDDIQYWSLYLLNDRIFVKNPAGRKDPLKHWGAAQRLRYIAKFVEYQARTASLLK
jgi:hypothetical protein